MRKLLFTVTLLSAICASSSAQIINGRDYVPENNPQQTQGNNDANTLPKPAQNQVSKTHPKKDTTGNYNKTNILQVGVCGLITSLNFFKNAQANPYYPALSCRLYYQPNNNIRFVADYSRVEKANLIPTWLNVRNTYFDIDAHFLMHFTGNVGIVYFILGASSQVWKSFYTGVDDYNSAADAKIQPNTNYKTIYFGANIGIGFEFKVLPRFDAYGEVRYRVSDTDVGFGLSDVCYGVGVKYTLIDFRPKAVYKKPSKHFKWF
jgi:hypothetical protein